MAGFEKNVKGMGGIKKIGKKTNGFIKKEGVPNVLERLGGKGGEITKGVQGKVTKEEGKELRTLINKTLKTVGATYGIRFVNECVLDNGDTLEKSLIGFLPKIDPSLRGVFCDIIMGLGSSDVGQCCSDLHQAIIATREITEIYASLDSLEKQKDFLQKARDYAFNRRGAFRERDRIRKTFSDLILSSDISGQNPINEGISKNANVLALIEELKRDVHACGSTEAMCKAINAKVAAAMSLGAIGAKEAIPELKKLTVDSFSTVRGAARAALRMMGVQIEAAEMKRMISEMRMPWDSK